MTVPALALAAVDKIYGAGGRHPVHAVRNLDLSVAAGEIVALLGSSGCGKTSTLRMVAGFEEATRGTVAIAGRPVNGLAPARRNVAMAFEGYSLYPPLTLRENIAFALKATSRDASEVAMRVGEVAELLEIEDILDRYPSSVSGGQQQRASLARALVRRADLYLLDEPMGQLEPQLRAVLRGRIKHFLRERGMTAILVTHDQTEANALADRIAVMEGGVLQQFATPRGLRDRPENLFVGTFIGEPPMNVMPATARAEAGGGLSFDLGDGIVLPFAAGAVAAPVREAALGRGTVTIGIRPDATRLAADGLPGRVVANQWIGDQTHLAAECAGRLIVAVEHGPVSARPGDAVRFEVRADDLHLFDTASGAAVAHGGTLA